MKNKCSECNHAQKTGVMKWNRSKTKKYEAIACDLSKRGISKDFYRGSKPKDCPLYIYLY